MWFVVPVPRNQAQGDGMRWMRERNVCSRNEPRRRRSEPLLSPEVGCWQSRVSIHYWFFNHDCDWVWFTTGNKEAGTTHVLGFQTEISYFRNFDYCPFFCHIDAGSWLASCLMVEDTQVPDINHHHSQGHWQLSHRSLCEFKLWLWWEIASIQWQHLLPL